MIGKIKRYFIDRREKRRLEEQKLFDDIWALGFDKIEFPIIIQDGADLSYVGDKDHFFGDPDIYFFEFDSMVRLIDSRGQQFTWDYSHGLKSNYPNKLVRQLTVEELMEIVDHYLKDVKGKSDLKDIRTIKELIDKIADYL